LSARVLVIEDNDVNLQLMCYVLQAHGHQTLTAGDGLLGLDVARRELPDLILCDVQMPLLDGFGVVREAKFDPRIQAIPIVAVTALAMVGDRDRILAAGFDGYIAKPIDPATMSGTINAFLPSELHATEPPQAPAERAASERSGRPVSATILALDDVSMNLELKRGLFEPLGFTVITAHTATEALALARRQRPDLVLSDVGLREGSGFDAIRAFKADPQLCKLPFVFLTATHFDAESRAKGLQLGADRYLSRPIDPEVLLREIRALLPR
jgi:two-component system, cell cycle response regulator